MTHKPEEHEEWKKNKAQFRRNKFNKVKAEEDKSGDQPSDKKLTISENLKAALLTHCNFTGAQIDELLQDAQSQSDF